MAKSDSLSEILSSLSPDVLRKLLLEEAEQHPAFRRKILELASLDNSSASGAYASSLKEEALEQIEEYWEKLNEMPRRRRVHEVEEGCFYRVDSIAREFVQKLLARQLFDEALSLLSDIEKEIKDFLAEEAEEAEIFREEDYLEEVNRLRKEVERKKKRGKVSELENFLEEIREGNYSDELLKKISSENELRKVLELLRSKIWNRRDLNLMAFFLLAKVIEKLGLDSEEILSIISPYQSFKEVRDWLLKLFQKRGETKRIIGLLEEEKEKRSQMGRQFPVLTYSYPDSRTFQRNLIGVKELVLLADQYAKLGEKEKESGVLQEMAANEAISSSLKILRRLEGLVSKEAFSSACGQFFANENANPMLKLQLAIEEKLPEEALKILDSFQRDRAGKNWLTGWWWDLAKQLDPYVTPMVHDAMPKRLKEVFLEQVPNFVSGKGIDRLMEIYLLLCIHPYRGNLDQELFAEIMEKYPGRKYLHSEMKKVLQEARVREWPKKKPWRAY